MPFLYRLTESELGTGWLPGIIIVCSQFKMKFLIFLFHFLFHFLILLVASQIVPCVKVTLCGLACQLPACPFSASAPGLCIPLLHTQTHTHHHWSPACAGQDQVLAISCGAAPLPAVLPACWSPAATATDPGAYIKKHNCLYTDPEGETGSFIVI